MKTSTQLFIAAIAVASAMAQGQSRDLPAVPPDSAAAYGVFPGQQFPRVFPDGRALFLLKAPEAKQVALSLPNKNVTMVNDGKGNWTVVTDAFGPGFHPYEFLVDGVRVCDPAMPHFWDMGRYVSGLEVPSPSEDAFYSMKNVPHGDIRERWFFSSVTQTWRRLMVYAPPGYDEHPRARYPVLYLMHGAGQNEACWSSQGRVAQIMDNLLADKMCVPMLVVMPNGYASRPGDEPGPQTAPPPGGRRPDFSRMFESFEELYTKDMIPYIDASFRTMPDRDHRALAGLSMGGMQTYTVGFDNLDKFAYLGGFSGGAGAFGGNIDLKTFHSGLLADAEAFNKRMKLVFLSTGTTEAQMMSGVLAFRDTATKAGIKIVYYESPRTNHEWQSWRRSLHEFAPLLFR